MRRRLEPGRGTRGTWTGDLGHPGRVPYRSFLGVEGPVALAHRGGAASTSENALSAFAAAQALGYRCVETDVRTTADGVPVVFHDPTLGRLAGSDARIDRLRLRELRAVRLDGGETVATLEEALLTFPSLRFNLDLKDAGSVVSAPPVLRRLGALGRVCVTSFSQRRVQAARTRLGPDVWTGLGVGGVASLLACAALHLPWPGDARVLQVPWLLAGGRRLPRRVVDAGHAAGLAVHVWTLDDPEEIARALDLGVDGVMTDRPEVLKAVLLARGEWR